MMTNQEFINDKAIKGLIQDLIGSMRAYGVNIDTETIHFYNVKIGETHLGQMGLANLIRLCTRIICNNPPAEGHTNNGGIIEILGELLARVIE